MIRCAEEAYPRMWHRMRSSRSARDPVVGPPSSRRTAFSSSIFRGTHRSFTSSTFPSRTARRTSARTASSPSFSHASCLPSPAAPPPASAALFFRPPPLRFPPPPAASPRTHQDEPAPAARPRRPSIIPEPMHRAAGCNQTTLSVACRQHGTRASASLADAAAARAMAPEALRTAHSGLARRAYPSISTLSITPFPERRESRPPAPDRPGPGGGARFALCLPNFNSRE